MAIEQKNTKQSSEEKPMNSKNGSNPAPEQPEEKPQQEKATRKGTRRSSRAKAEGSSLSTETNTVSSEGYQEKTMDGRRVLRFMKFRKIMGLMSLIVVLAALGGLVTKGLNLGLDFTGGVSAEVAYENPVQPAAVNAALEKAGFKNPTVQNFGTQRNIQLRVPPQSGEGLVEKLTKAVQLPDNKATVLKVDAVGAQVGEELYVRSFGALALALACMMLFIAIRYQFKLAVGAVMALAHDVIIVIGIFAIFGWTFDFSVLAAVLALIGYSLNDTIVVFDRIRENFRRIRGAAAEKVVDISLTETLRRTIMTSVSTMVVVLAMLIYGGDGLRWFSVALMLGLIAGTYSSIYIASNYALTMGLDRSDFVVKVKPEFEEEVVDFE